MVGPMVIVHLLVDTLDAMGANAVNTMAEAVAPYLEEITGGTAELRIFIQPCRSQTGNSPCRIQKRGNRRRGSSR